MQKLYFLQHLYLPNERTFIFVEHLIYQERPHVYLLKHLTFHRSYKITYAWPGETRWFPFRNSHFTKRKLFPRYAIQCQLSTPHSYKKFIFGFHSEHLDIPASTPVRNTYFLELLYKLQ